MADLEEIKRINITEIAGLLGFRIKRIGRYYTMKEHDSVRIDPEKNIFIRNSTGECGSVIDFVMTFKGCSVSEAISYLRAGVYGYQKVCAHSKENSSEPTKKTFALPEADSTMKNVFAYLVKTRCIDPAVVKMMVKNKYLFQDKKKNCVFTGYKDGMPVFAALRGTNTYRKFVGDVSGSDYTVCFFVSGTDPPGRMDMLTITESPIDALSVMTMDLFDKGDMLYSDQLALCGCSKAEKAIKNHMSKKKYNIVRLCLDNDEAGKRAEAEIKRLLFNCGFDGKILSDMPSDCKDKNDELIGRKKKRSNKK